MPAHRKFDHEQAFEFWYNEPFHRQTITATAKAFGVTIDSMHKTSQKEEWRDRAEKRDAAVRRETERKAVKTHAQRVIDNLRFIDAMKAIFARNLSPDDPNHIDLITPREFIEIVKLEQLMTGNPSSISGDGVKPRSLEEIERELLDVPESEVAEFLTVVESIRGDNGSQPEGS